MKKTNLLAVACSLFSVGAFACPNLSGTFSCPDAQNGPQIVTITQSESNGITTYYQNGEALAADNVVKSIPDEPTFKEGKMRAYCEGDSLKVAVQGKVWDQGQFFGDLDVVSNYSLDASSNLVDKFEGNIKSAQGDYPIGDLTTCTRQ